MGKKTKNKQKNKVLQPVTLARYEAAGITRTTENWYASDSGPNSGMRYDWQWLVKRHQDLADNDPLAGKAVGTIVNNWIGDGIMSTPNGATKRYRNLYNEWADMPESDFYERHNYYGGQSLGARTCAIRGAYLIRKRINPTLLEKYGVAPLQVQILEAEWLDTTKDNGTDIIFGQKFDSSGRLVGYWIRDQHPNETAWGLGSSITSQLVPKEEMSLIFDCLRPGQRMGIPFGTAAILTLRDIADINTAQQLKDKIAACFFGVTHGDDQTYLNPADPREKVVNGSLFDTISPGTVEHLPPGRMFQAFTPPSSGDFSSTQKIYAHRVAAAYQVLPWQITGDLSEVNYSSIRGGWIEFHKRIGYLRWNLAIPHHCRTVCRWHDELARMAGILKGPMTWEHTPPRRELQDPTKEIPALIEAVRAGFMSLSEVKRSFGYVPEQVMTELAEDIKAARGAGLVLSVDGMTEKVQSAPKPDQQQLPEVNP